MPVLKTFLHTPSQATRVLQETLTPCTTVRMIPAKDAGHNKLRVYYGDEITVSIKDSLSIVWGSSTPSSWDTLKDAVRWEWHIPDMRLDVYYANGTVKSRLAPTWSDLKVDIEVLESHNFLYVFNHTKTPLKGTVVGTFVWGHFGVPNSDNIETFVRNAVYNLPHNSTPQKSSIFPRRLLLLKDVEGLGGSVDPNEKVHYAHIEKFVWTPPQDLSPSLVSTVKVFFAIYRGLNEEMAKKDDKSGVLGRRKASWLLCCISASLLIALSEENRATYEPWMLWRMWTWLHDFTYSANSPHTYEVSPNWGDT